MNISYVKNTWQDFNKVDLLAQKIYQELPNHRNPYLRWELDGDKFYIIADCYECGCNDVIWFPIGWLELTPEDIGQKFVEDMKKPYNERVCGEE